MLSLRQVRRLRGLDGRRIVADYGPSTRERFRPEGVPVVIAARNEEADLPATLLALAASTMPVAPYVVVNGTTDATAERAEAMGATVLHSEVSFKMAALQLGVATVLDSGRTGPILFTDADTLVGRRWAQIMATTCLARTTPVVTLGNSVFTHGESATADALRSARKVLLAQALQARGKQARAHGHNMAIDFARSRRAVDAYLSIDPARFIGEEEEIVARIRAVGGTWRPALSVGALVVTRGDRFRVADLWRMRRDPDFTARRARYTEYGDIKPFVPTAQPGPVAGGDRSGEQVVPVGTGAQDESRAEARQSGGSRLAG